MIKKQCELNPDFLALQPPRFDYVKCAHRTGDGWYFYWAPLDKQGYPEETDEDFHISEFPVLGDSVTAHELGFMGVIVV